MSAVAHPPFSSSSTNTNTVDDDEDPQRLPPPQLWLLLLVSGGKNWWQQYQQWVRRNRDSLWLCDASLSRLLLLFVHNNNSNNNNNNNNSTSQQHSSSSWRPVAWGLLELHRLLLEYVLHPEDHNNGGFSMQVTTTTTSTATAQQQLLRGALTVVHALAPIALEWCGPSSSSSSQQHVAARVRQTTERLRFVLRLTLLLNYWRQVQQQQQQQQQQNKTHGVLVSPGLLLQGGRAFYPQGPGTAATAIPTTLEEEQYILQRNQYVGHRTGRRVMPQTATATTNNTTTTSTTGRFRTYLGELLYILRPLLQAEVEAVVSSSSLCSSSQRLLQRSWLVGLALDLISLQCTTTTKQQHPQYDNNANHRRATATAEERQRRQMRLLLYLLRTPVWQRVTEPMAQKVASVLKQRIPLLGGWMHNYIWDFLYYWKDYRLEEG